MICIVSVTIVSIVITPYAYLCYGYTAAFYEPFAILAYMNVHACGNSFVMSCLDCDSLHFYEQDTYQRNNHHGNASLSENSDHSIIDQSWDRFITQCIETTSELIKERWITLENVQSMDPSVITSIPAVAILTILMDSCIINESGLEKEYDTIKWHDGTICNNINRPTSDRILNYLWPMVVDLKKTLILSKSQSELLEANNTKIITAMLCSNSQEDTTDLKKFILENINNDNGDDSDTKIDEVRDEENKALRTKIMNLVITITRVKPYINRIGKIYEHKYDDDDAEQKIVDIMEKGEINKQNDNAHPSSFITENDEANEQDICTNSTNLVTEKCETNQQNNDANSRNLITEKGETNQQDDDACSNIDPNSMKSIYENKYNDDDAEQKILNVMEKGEINKQNDNANSSSLITENDEANEQDDHTKL